MKIINSSQIIEAIAKGCQKANYQVRPDVLRALKNARDRETGLAREVLSLTLKNLREAKQNSLPLCQDTGLVTVFVSLGDKVKIEGNLERAINKGVSKGYREGHFRNSVVRDPIKRTLSSSNAPAVIHIYLRQGKDLKFIIEPRGFGCENKTRLSLLAPTTPEEKIEEFITTTVIEEAADACPPVIVGVGIGGTAEKALLLSKEALLRKLYQRHPYPHIALLEKKTLQKINASRIGPQGLGGKTTALGVNIEVYPTHIAGLPVAISLSCHALRCVKVKI